MVFINERNERSENIMLWTEKYRPKNIKEIYGQNNFVLDAEHWIQNKEMPNLLLYGVAGVGKTTAAIALANDLLGEFIKANFFEINASDDRKLETVRTRIKEIASTSKIGEVPFKIILLDEMDGMTKDAQNALKRIMERYSSNCRFIITCNSRHKIIFPLQSRCANYLFKRLTDSDMVQVMTSVLNEEGILSVSEDDLEKFITYLHGDIRRGLTELQASVSSNSSLLYQIDKNLEPYTKILELINTNEYTNCLEKVHKLLYQSVDMKTICINLHDTIVKSDLEPKNKFKLLRVVGECEWRSSNMTPKVLASWMVGQMI
tara:strand:- start:1618 stop:2571 length:954 start_codon:yes stop_codon:yes gene_type:complete